MSRKLLILGSTGFLGRYFMESENTIGIGRTPIKKFNNRNYIIDPLNIEELSKVVDHVRPTAIINCIAKTSIEECEKYPDVAYRVNSEFPAQIALITQEKSLPFVHFSTDAVFDGSQSPYTESDSPNPISIYGETKFQGEKNVMTTNPDSYVLRTNFFGFSFERQSLFNYFFNKLKDQKTCIGFTDVLFSPIYVKDLCSATQALLNKNAGGGLFHVVGDQSLSKYEFGRNIALAMGFESNLIRSSNRPATKDNLVRSYDLRLSSAKMKQYFRCSFSILEGIIDSLAIAKRRLTQDEQQNN